MRSGLSRVASSLLLVAGAVARAAAQDDAAPIRDAQSIEDRPGFVAAVEQIAQGKEREGLAALAAILAQFPDDADRFMLHYNVACGHARLKEIDAAFSELKEAVERGYGVIPTQLVNLKQDPDLDALRSDARFQPLCDRAVARTDEIRVHWNELVAPFTWTPPPPTDPEEAKKPVPLLIVLHPFAAERESFARNFFLPFAEKHRFALFAPSGEQLVAPGRFAWSAGGADFLDHVHAEERRVFVALDAWKKKVAIDPERIYIVGLGQGAGLGFTIALCNPQWVRGAVLFGGGYAPATVRDWVERSAKYQRRTALVHGQSDAIYPFAPLPAFAEALRGRGLAVELAPVACGHDIRPETITATLEEKLRWIDERPFFLPGLPTVPPARKN